MWEYRIHKCLFVWIGPLQDPVTWYRINYMYAGMQVRQWDFQNKGKSGWTGTNSFVLEVPLRNLRPSIINSVSCDQIMQRVYFKENGQFERMLHVYGSKQTQGLRQRGPRKCLEHTWQNWRWWIFKCQSRHKTKEIPLKEDCDHLDPHQQHIFNWLM